MHLLYSFIENVLVMILTVAVLIGGLYVLLVLLQYGLKLRSRGREEGLAELWQETLSKPPSNDHTDHSDR